MDRNILLVLFSLVMSFILIPANAAEPRLHSPIGYWKTIDDATGKPKSIVHIWKTDENVLMGKVIKVFGKEGTKQASLCTKCKGAKRNQPLVGMVILSGLKAKENQWSNGEILDIDNGKTYNCNMRTVENGKRLHVQGFTGLPIIGRSQTWERVDLMSG